MDKIISQFVTIAMTLITLGMPGFFSFWLMDKVGIITDNPHKADNKKILLVILSIVNTFIPIVILCYYFNVSTLSELVPKIDSVSLLFLTVIGSLVISFILVLFYGGIKKLIYYLINVYLKINGRATNSKYSGYKTALTDDCPKIIFIEDMSTGRLTTSGPVIEVTESEYEPLHFLLGQMDPQLTYIDTTDKLLAYIEYNNSTVSYQKYVDVEKKIIIHVIKMKEQPLSE